MAIFATASGAASVWRGINTFWPTVLALSLDNMGHDSDVEGFTGHEDCSREVKTQRATATVSQNMLTLLSKCMISEYFYVLPHQREEYPFLVFSMRFNATFSSLAASGWVRRFLSCQQWELTRLTPVHF